MVIRRVCGIVVTGYLALILVVPSRLKGKGPGGSRLSGIGRTIHASPGRFH